MTSIYFVGTYKPIMCGIADYTSYLTSESPAGKWGILSFDLEKCDLRVTANSDVSPGLFWYGIPGRYDYSALAIAQGVQALGGGNKDVVLWFQHEFGIWADSEMFTAMVRDLDVPKVVTFHTLHFQSIETPGGLERREYNLLQELLPCVDAITVFSQGVHRAVTSAFPQYYAKVHVMRHGVHSYPHVVRLSRKEAKEKLHNFLISDSGLDRATKEALCTQRVFLDPDAVVVGQTGFLGSLKQSETLYLVRDDLQRLVPDKRIIAVRIGGPRDEEGRIDAMRLRKQQNWRDKFLLEVWLPQDMLPVAQRAFDVNFYWPADCTQSGVLGHALGAGAVVAGRDLEGVGEALKESGGLTDRDMKHLEMKIRRLIVNPGLRGEIEERALLYAAEFSWRNQARRHYELAEHVLSSAFTVPLPRSYPAIDIENASVDGRPNPDKLGPKAYGV